MHKNKHNNTMKRIGILAGMGPRSTSPFLEMVLDECQIQYGAKYDIDYPHMMIYSLPTPFYIDREVDETALKNYIKTGLNNLVEAGVDIVAIPCNSAHKYFEAITEGVTVPVLNIVDEALDAIPENSKVAILSTELTFNSGIYQKGISAKMCTLIHESEWQQSVNAIIMKIKANEDIKEIIGLWHRLERQLLDAQIDFVILACTDLNVLFDKIDLKIKIIDTSKKLAQALVKNYLLLE
ncbi:aspartate/glutamate racemase family protein [Fusibacter sp. 3D3]|uniref:aspartate/glutamate racemase family protein n=1 Tax=Fusibacter sp. 3D3 TaxID=1048380 RepID=UPI00085389A3|nr:amino acid racemase [Fusibacter sp. 3D3]GAU78481.1 aspartate racemase [Fusibacter sp. 3D3]